MDKPDFSAMGYDDIIAFCIKLEKDSIALYQNLVDSADNASSRQFYESLVKMEKGHVQKFENLGEDEFFKSAPKQVIDLKITDYMVDMDPKQARTWQDIIAMAAKGEAMARELYLELAGKYADEPFLREFFQMMAEEEAQHKLDLELEYERAVLGEN